MKQAPIILLIAFFINGCGNLGGASELDLIPLDGHIIYEVSEIDSEPEPIGGFQALFRGMRYPGEARQAGVEGRVTVNFIVDKNGYVRHPFIAEGIGHGCNQEALRLVKKAKFHPGMIGDEPVNVQYSIPILFRLWN